MTQPSSNITECSECGATIIYHERFCHACAADVGFPNVRQAIIEEPQLQQHYDTAIVDADIRGVQQQLNNFEKCVESSNAILVIPFNKVIEIVNSSHSLYTTFANNISSGARIAEDNKWDRGRTAAESTVHPLYHEDICYSVLSLTNVGLSYYGDCHITLNPKYIEKRTSVFEENAFIFMEKHQVIAGKGIPKGHRATWKRRGVLAVAKLHSKIEKDTKEDDFQSVLISDGDKDTGDFIEAQIYGAIHASNFSKIRVIRDMSPAQRALFNVHKTKIEALGIDVQEEMTK